MTPLALIKPEEGHFVASHTPLSPPGGSPGKYYNFNSICNRELNFLRLRDYLQSMCFLLHCWVCFNLIFRSYGNAGAFFSMVLDLTRRRKCCSM